MNVRCAMLSAFVVLALAVTAAVKGAGGVAFALSRDGGTWREAGLHLDKFFSPDGPPRPGLLPPDRRCYWHVRARDSRGVWGEWSKTWSFRP